MNFITIPYDLLARTDLTASEKNLMGLIHSLSAKEGYCFASNQYLADALGMKLSGIRNCLAELYTKGLITRVVKRKDNNEIESREIKLVTPLMLEQHTPMMPQQHTSVATASHNKETNIKENNNSIERFEEFWNIYNKRVGKEKTKAKWSKLKEKEIDAIFKALPTYVATREVKYRKDPERYLGHRVWEDEIPNTTLTTTPLSANKITEIIIPTDF
jgi:hypothetical protein